MAGRTIFHGKLSDYKNEKIQVVLDRAQELNNQTIFDKNLFQNFVSSLSELTEHFDGGVFAVKSTLETWEKIKACRSEIDEELDWWAFYHRPLN